MPKFGIIIFVFDALKVTIMVVASVGEVTSPYRPTCSV